MCIFSGFCKFMIRFLFLACTALGFFSPYYIYYIFSVYKMPRNFVEKRFTLKIFVSIGETTFIKIVAHFKGNYELI